MRRLDKQIVDICIDYFKDIHPADTDWKINMSYKRRGSSIDCFIGGCDKSIGTIVIKEEKVGIFKLSTRYSPSFRGYLLKKFNENHINISENP